MTIFSNIEIDISNLQIFSYMNIDLCLSFIYNQRKKRKQNSFIFYYVFFPVNFLKILYTSKYLKKNLPSSGKTLKDLFYSFLFQSFARWNFLYTIR